MRKERLAEYRPVKTVMAVQMWENGFGLLDAEGYELPRYKNENSDYTAFEDKKDNSLLLSESPLSPLMEFLLIVQKTNRGGPCCL